MTLPVPVEAPSTTVASSGGSRWLRLMRQVGVHVVIAVVAVWGASTVVFLITRLTGNPVRLMSPPGATQAQREATARYFGLNHSVLHQYGVYLSGLVRGNFGQSFYWGEGAGTVVAAHVAATLRLAVVSFVLTLVIALPMALVAARRAGGWIDRLFTAGASLGLAVPQFWLGPLLVSGFAVTEHYLPASGDIGWRSVILPAVTLSCAQIGVLFVLARSALVQQLHERYVDTARSKGASGRRVMLVHVVPNAGLEILTVIGLILANLIASDVIVENVFSWPGLGSLLISSVTQFDFPVVQALTLVYAVVFIGTMMVVDLLCRLVDPRT